ncbi:MAG: transposase [Bacteroidaceae bacterium]|nr:transposase [Bacteroidaceae bacterium]
MEGVFLHLKRMIKGVYQHFSNSNIVQYLNESAWRWTHFDDELEYKIESLFHSRK